MHSFFFGTSSRPLFGVYHAPRSSPSERGVVLCYPIGQEYMRGHRAFRQLALLLARSGFHVLRFDYYATGDSAGASEEGSPDQWLADVEAAIDELKDMAEVERVSLVGARLGAALAAQVAGRRDDVDRVVLWDPVVGGAAYVEEVLMAPGARSWPGVGNDDDSVVAVVNGFPLTRRMQAEMAAIDLTTASTRPGQALRIVVSHERAEYDRLRRVLEARSGSATYGHIAARGDWNEVDNFGSALLPQEVIQDIVRWLEEKVTA